MKFTAYAKRSGEKLCWLSSDTIEAIISWGNNNKRKLEYNSIYVTTRDRRGDTQLCAVLDIHDSDYVPFYEILPGSGKYQHYSDVATWERAGDAHQEYIDLISWGEFLWSEWIENIYLAPDGSETTNLPD